jgi:putative endonuclease
VKADERRLDRPIKNYMYYVYFLRSLKNPQQTYIGHTDNLKQRLVTHNSGGSVYTATYKPWKLVLYLAFADETKAKEFEHYLKTSAGKAFTKKRLW